jgi:hypothetical protein
VTPAQLDDREAAVDAIIRRRMSMLDIYMDRILDGIERDAVPEGLA